MNIYIVTIDGKRHYVRAPGKREATRIAIDHISEETRMASHDDLALIFRRNHPIIGHAAAVSDTQDLTLNEPNAGRHHE